MNRQALTIENNITILRGITEQLEAKYLWNQKANVLSRLRKTDTSYEQQALECFRFRARAFPKDFMGLNELIGIYKDKDQENDAWAWVDLNLKCPIIPLSEIAGRASISVVEYQVGFLNAQLFPAFGSLWLTMNPPADSDQLVGLFAAGLDCLQNAIVIETCWQIKFLTLAFGISYDFSPEGDRLDWTEIDSKVKDLFSAQVLADWSP